jgi:formylglycine-generating enzyme required for sulfatase activity
MLCINCFSPEIRGDTCVRCQFSQVETARDRRALKAGMRVNDKYLIGRVLGAGGFGITYLALDVTLERIVALKEFVPSGLTGRGSDGLELECNTYEDREPFQRGLNKFFEEGKTLAKFKHPNIIQVFEVLRANGTAYLAMEYHKGMTLKEKLKQLGPYQEATALKIMGFVFDALRIVHRENVVHRDIKPDNIYMEEKGRIILLDFGGAKQLAVAAERSVDIMVAHGYAAPEQYYLRAEDIGTWTDIYACGATLFKLLTGETPPSSLARRDGNSELVWGTGNISEGVKNAVKRAMLLSRKERVQTVDEFQNILPEPSFPQDTSNGPDGGRRTAFMAASVLSVGVIFLIGIFALKKPISPTPPPIPSVKIGFCADKLLQSSFSHPKMISIPAGQYKIGSGFREGEAPANTLGGIISVISEFEMAETEITTEQWQACVDDGVCDKEVMRGNKSSVNRSGHEGAAFPVTNVNWNDAQTYVKWLSKKSGVRFYLPTESEWEYAAWGDAKTMFPWGATIGKNNAQCAQCEPRFNIEGTAPVKNFAPNGYGLYDMQGNASEWVEDCWKPSHDAVVPLGNEAGCARVQKGGAFSSAEKEMHPAFRMALEKEERSMESGFRVACRK